MMEELIAFQGIQKRNVADDEYNTNDYLDGDNVDEYFVDAVVAGDDDGSN